MQLIDEPELTPGLIRSRHDALTARLRTAAEGAGRDPDGFRVVAVTKGFGVAVVRAALAAGLTALGENRVQEAIPKVQAFPEAEWHLVGHLQSNKVRPAIALFGTIHAADSLDLLRRIDRIAHDDGRSPRVLLQVNVGGEPSKSGFDVNWFADQAVHRDELVACRSELGTARVVGLMTIAPEGAPPTTRHAVFATLRRLRDGLQETIGRGLPELSMGMTADAEAAVAEGATMVRIGTALFGPRPHPA